jgi:hypothetical protein
MSKNVMRVLDRALGLMECKVCGRRHFAGLGDSSHYVRGAWECQNGCELVEIDGLDKREGRTAATIDPEDLTQTSVRI